MTEGPTAQGDVDAPSQGSDAFLVVTGLSGSGKSLAHRCFEDMGYFCIDNLPTALIPKFSEMRRRGGPALGRVVLTVDVREREFLADLPAVVAQLRARHGGMELVFMEADDEALVRRFSETRRPHPLAGDRPLAEGIAAERELLADLRGEADLILDTSELSPKELRELLWRRFGGGAEGRLHVGLVSFGYRHGLPKEADLVFDVRFLPNPYYLDSLRPLTGQDAPVQRYLAGQPAFREFMRLVTQMLDFLLPAYHSEGKSYLTIAVGCTGGQHRSVAVIEELHRHLQGRDVEAAKSHRDAGRHAR